MADFGRNCARIKTTRFFPRRNSPKFLTREKNLSKHSLPFSFLSGQFAFRGIFARKNAKLPDFFRLFSCQIS